MQFVERHLTKHHLLHKPHKWFLAFISSPIHFAEMHYKKKYHLNFKHAKKLFVFDILLLFSIIILAISTISWFAYDPGIAKYVDLSIKPSIDRIISGDYITYNIKYKNNSEKTLQDSILFINLPKGFIVDKTIPQNKFNSENNSFILENILKNEQAELEISGWYYDTPHQETHVTLELSYLQDDRKDRESKLTNLIQTHRGSILEGNLKLSNYTLAQGTLPLQINLKNTGKQKLENIILPLNLPTGLEITNLRSESGTIENLTWQIAELLPNQEVLLNASLKTNLSGTLDKISFDLTPKIEVNNELIDQTTLNHELNILHPKVDLDSYWQDKVNTITPGETKTLILNLKNSGQIDLENLQIILPVPINVVDVNKLNNLNPGKLTNNNLTINKNYSANLASLTSGNSTEISLQIPIKHLPQGGTNLNLALSLQVKAGVKLIANAEYETNILSPAIKIGTQLTLGSELRYYTDEGDQLGRGSLPPQVGKETKYWAWIKIQNNTSEVTDLQFSAKLPNYVNWTGKSSVSLGSNLDFNTDSKIVSWQTSSLGPYQTAGLYFELALTPTANQIGISPILLENIQISAQDNYINQEISKFSQNLDISLPADKIGKNKGVFVLE